jgi:polyhydroxyalkanoate synthesis regulator phasin
MSEEQTDRLEGGTPFEIRVLRELSNINQRLDGLERRLTALEEKVDARLHDTRPIWEAVLSRLGSIETRLDRMEAKLNVFSKDLVETRTDVEMLKERPPAA